MLEWSSQAVGETVKSTVEGSENSRNPMVTRSAKETSDEFKIRQEELL